jgi:hypothetical protein
VDAYADTRKGGREVSLPNQGTLLQTRVSKSLANWIRAKAKREGISVAAWLRRNLILYKFGEEVRKDEKK